MNRKTVKFLDLLFKEMYDSFNDKDRKLIHIGYTEILGFCEALYSSEIITDNAYMIYTGEAFRVYSI